MEQKYDILEGEYVLTLDHCDARAMIGHVDHVNRSGKSGFGSVAVPIGYLSAHIAQGVPEISRKHWSVRLFFRSDISYDQASQTTIVHPPKQPESQNRSLFRRSMSVPDNSSPRYHPGLPEALGRALLDAHLCDEPMGVQVDHTTHGPLVHFGAIYDDQ